MDNWIIVVGSTNPSFDHILQIICRKQSLEIDWRTILCPVGFSNIPVAVILFLTNTEQHEGNTLFMEWLGVVQTAGTNGDRPKYFVYRPQGHLGGPGLYQASAATKEYYCPPNPWVGDRQGLVDQVTQEIEEILQLSLN